MRARLAAPALYAAAALAATGLLHVRDPHGAGAYAYCPWLLLTGTHCPGCGGLRAVHDLTHADLAGALSSNALVVLLLPIAGVLWAGWVRARWRGRAFRPTAVGPMLYGVLGAMLTFALLRNLEPAGWLAP